MSNILPGKASARSWKRAGGTGKLSPFACPLPQSARERCQEQEAAWGWGQGKETQMEPICTMEGAEESQVPGRGERGCSVARQEAQVGGGSPGSPQSRAGSQSLAQRCQKQLILERRRLG